MDLASYSFSYSKYLELREERFAMAEASERKRQSILRVEPSVRRQFPGDQPQQSGLSRAVAAHNADAVAAQQIVGETADDRAVPIGF